jgi:hypothetical protein
VAFTKAALRALGRTMAAPIDALAHSLSVR